MFITSLELKIAFSYLQIKKFRGIIAVLSFIGITLGVATLIVVTSIMNGFRSELFFYIAGVNGHVNIINKNLTYDQLKVATEPINDIEGVVKLIPFTELQSIAVVGKDATGVLIKGATYQDIIKEGLITNKIIQGDISKITQGVVIGSKMANDFGIKIGDEIAFLSSESFQSFMGRMPRVKRFKVCAIFFLGMAEYDSMLVYMPFKFASILSGQQDKPNVINVYIKDINNASKIAKAIQDIVDMPVTHWQERQNAYYKALKIEKNVMFVILTMIVIVAAFNIISSLFMLVDEKVKSIAILRTLGMTKLAIVKIFMLCGLLIGVAGTILGSLLGVFLTQNIEKIRSILEFITQDKIFDPQVYSFEKIPFILETSEISAIILMALGLSFLASIPAAVAALRHEPGQVLR